jgi:hypothetical protein
MVVPRQRSIGSTRASASLEPPHMHAARFGVGGQFFGQLRTRSRHVDKHGVAARMVDQTIVTQVQRTDIIRSADDRKDDVRHRSKGLRGRVPVRAGLDERLGLGACPVVDVQRIAGRREPRGHGGPHDTEADKANRWLGRSLIHDGWVR